MIPRTFPSTYASNGQQQMVVHFLTSVAGLARWSDYIPVKLVQGGPENSYSGTIDVAVIPSLTAQTQAWKEYIPVYLDDAGTDAWTVNAVGYIPYNYALFTDASMQLDLTNGGELDPRVTFTRTSNATVTDSTGTLVYAPHNLLTFSESFDNAVWQKLNATVTANTIVAPNETTTADTLVRSGTSVSLLLSPDFATGAVPLSYSVYAKAGTQNYLVLQVGVNNTTNVSFVTFDLTTGVAGTTQVILGSGVSLTASSALTENGWYRCNVSFTGGATNSNLRLGASSSEDTRNGDNAGTIFIWGAQLNVGSLQPYYPTTRKNLLGFTQEFNNAGWVKANVTVSATKVTAPDGSVTGQKIEETVDNGQHRINAAAVTVVSGSLYAASVYMKAAERTLCSTEVILSPGGAEAIFNLANGTVSFSSYGGAATPTGSITDVGNGWYRCVIIFAANGVSATVRSAKLYQSAGVQTYAGTLGSGIFIWGAQLSDSASLDPYVYNPGAAPASTAYFGPRFDYDPVTLAPKGLLIEESRTNSIRNNTMVGAVVGTPGTLPTNWSVIIANGLTTTVSAVGTSNGIPYVDLNIAGTPTGTSWLLAFDATNAIAALATQVWTGSFYTAIVGGSTTNIANIRNIITPRNAALGALSASTVNFTPTGSLARQTNTHTMPTDTAFVQYSVSIQTTIGAAIDITLRIGLPQLELGAFATSVIPTTTATATRAADVAVMQGANFSNWYRSDEGSLFTDVGSVGPSNGARSATLSDGTIDNQAWIRNANTPTNAAEIYTAGAFVAQIGINTGVAARTALALKANDFAVSVNGGAASTDTSGALGVYNRMTLGSNFNNSGVFINGHIRRLAFFPRRLANAELTALTS
jgi:hypothetical protein